MRELIHRRSWAPWFCHDVEVRRHAAHASKRQTGFTQTFHNMSKPKKGE